MGNYSDVAQAYFNAWNRPEDVSQILQSQAHNNAKKRLWDNLGASLFKYISPIFEEKR